MPAKSTSLPLIFSLLDTPAFGGAEQYVLAQLMYLARQGYPVVVATNQPQVKSIYEDRLAQAHLTNVQVITAPYRLDIIGDWKGLLKFFWGLPGAVMWASQILGRLSSSHQVICLWPGWTDRLVFSPLAKLFGCRLVWIEIGPLAPLFARNFGLPKLLHRLVHRLPDHVITTSDWTAQSLIQTGHVPSQDVTLMYPGIKPVSDHQLATLKRTGQAWLTAHHLGQKQIIGWVGRLARENELELLLPALTQLSPRYHVLVIGDGPDKNHYQQLARDLGLAHRVTFTGFVSEKLKPALVAACQLFVFTRAWDLDGFGMTTIEAMNVGVPVITSRYGPQLEIVTQGSTGWYFEPHSVKSLTTTLNQVFRWSPQRRHKVGQQGRASVAQRFSLEMSLNQLLAVIRAETESNLES